MPKHDGNAEKSNVFVAVRLREAHSGESCLQRNDPQSVTILNEDRGDKTFTFDRVFAPDEGQLDVYNTLGTRVLDNAVAGFNACLFAYGQTGSGKTYTMLGGDGGEGSAPPGLIPNLCDDLFRRLRDKATDTPGFSCTVEVEYMELYGEKVRDLLHPETAALGHTDLKVREHPKRGPYVEGLLRKTVRSAGDVAALMAAGNKERTTAATNMNAVSSRSHAVFVLTLTQREKGEKGHVVSAKTSVVNLIDLAGSERVKDSGVEGKHLKEAGAINSSLSALGNVISGLASGKAEHIPYRNSKLTWLLRESLGGNSKTVMVATAYCNPRHYGETMSTLRYASQCKYIVNSATVNEDPTAARINALQATVADLRAKLMMLQNGSGDAASILKELTLSTEVMDKLNSIYEHEECADNRRGELEGVEARIAELERNRGTNTAEYRSLKKRAAELQKAVGEEKRALDELKQITAALTVEKEEVAKKNLEIKVLSAEFRQHREETEAERRALEGEHQEIRRREDELRSKLDTKDDALSRILRQHEQETTAMRQKIQELRQAVAAARMQRDELQRVLNEEDDRAAHHGRSTSRGTPNRGAAPAAAAGRPPPRNGSPNREMTPHEQRRLALLRFLYAQDDEAERVAKVLKEREKEISSLRVHLDASQRVADEDIKEKSPLRSPGAPVSTRSAASASESGSSNTRRTTDPSPRVPSPHGNPHVPALHLRSQGISPDGSGQESSGPSSDQRRPSRPPGVPPLSLHALPHGLPSSSGAAAAGSPPSFSATSPISTGFSSRTGDSSSRSITPQYQHAYPHTTITSHPHGSFSTGAMPRSHSLPVPGASEKERKKHAKAVRRQKKERKEREKAEKKARKSAKKSSARSASPL